MQNQTRNSASTFGNTVKSGLTLVGDLALNDPLIDGKTFDSVITGTNLTLKELEFDDYLNTSLVTNQAKNNA